MGQSEKFSQSPESGHIRADKVFKFIFMCEFVSKKEEISKEQSVIYSAFEVQQRHAYSLRDILEKSKRKIKKNHTIDVDLIAPFDLCASSVDPWR